MQMRIEWLLVLAAVLGCDATDVDPPGVDAAGVDASPPDGAVDAEPPADGAAQVPDAMVLGPDAAVSDPDATVVDPDAMVLDPDAMVLDPDAAVLSPDATVLDPDAAVPSPDAAPPEPDAAPLEPDAAPICGDGTCDGADPGSEEGVLAPMEGCHFRLRLQDDVDSAHDIMDRVAELAGGYVSLDDVLLDLNREGQPGITAGAADRLRNHDWVGFRWNAGDQDVDYWMPQGITGHSDADAEPRADGRRLIMVSWYHRTEERPTKGARISLADYTDLDAVRYRHLLLVEPVERGGSPSFAPAEYDSGNALHAGGIVWWGDLLYVADTSQGFRVFDTRRIVRIDDTDDRDRVGVSPGRVDAHGYRYVVPQIARYRRAEGACQINFSFVALDRSSDPPTLLSGEYTRDDPHGRLVNWRLDPDTGWLEERGGISVGVDGHVSGQTRVQGALRWQGDYYLSSSSQVGRLGRLYRNRPGEASRITAWPYGCEDLYYERDADLVWTPTEHPGAREVVGIPLVRP